MGEFAFYKITIVTIEKQENKSPYSQNNIRNLNKRIDKARNVSHSRRLPYVRLV